MKWDEAERRGLVIKSRPARGAWIEITYLSLVDVRGMVAPRKGRVD